MRLKIKTIILSMFTTAVLLAAAGVVSAQSPCLHTKRLNPPAATAKGFIGGESHNCYLIRASRGKTMTVKISWRREDDNNASFSVAKGTTPSNAEQVNFGRESNGGRTWTGKIPVTGNYLIDVVAHPSANYTLRVTVR